MNKQFETGLMWFRRDLRVIDNAALCSALQACRQVHCVFVFDQDILAALPRADRRVEFIRAALCELDEDLRQLSGTPGAGLIVRHGRAVDEIVALAKELQAQAVFAAHDYEPQSRARDARVLDALADAGVALQTCKDHVIFEGREILTQTGTSYGVFTPYKNNWLATVTPQHLRSHDVPPLASTLASRPETMQLPVPTLAQIGFKRPIWANSKSLPARRGDASCSRTSSSAWTTTTKRAISRP